jgi:lipoprotein-anchoring transpeptidase ErfK/SrfK
MSSMARRLSLPIMIAVAAVVAVAWTKPPSSGPVFAGRTAAAPRCTAGTHQAVGGKRIAFAAVARKTIHVYRHPGSRPLAWFARINQNGYPTVFEIRDAVLDSGCARAWFHVQVPLRPNGATAYVRARDVDVGRVTTRIVVDVSARSLTLYRAARPILRAVVAVGAPATPTPLGHFYVNQRLVPTDTSGPFGPAALGISAFSPVLTGWAQGGPIAIHGTNEPWSIGHASSNGCVRVRNDVLQRIFALTWAGTPVVIKA